MTESTDQPNITDESNQDLLQDGVNDHESNNSNTNALSPIPFQALSKHYPKLNAFSSFIGWAIILIIMFVVDLLVDKINLHFLVLPGLLFFSLLSGVVGYFSAKACGYYQDEFDIYFKQGLWWKKQVALNFSRIQHIDISHGPLERRYQMATIKFFTAGGATSDLRISGLPNSQAEQIRADILRYAKENIINDELTIVEDDSSQPTVHSESSEIIESKLEDSASEGENTTRGNKND
jgi:uncharacterized protein